jgi:hypothetical protein
MALGREADGQAGPEEHGRRPMHRTDGRGWVTGGTTKKRETG